jgi:hypothetical protein
MRSCSQAGITDAAFANLAGIHTLSMSSCSQAGITAAAFAHLAGMHTLNVRHCNAHTIAGAQLLQGLTSLEGVGAFLPSHL